MVSKTRADRISRRIQEELSKILIFEATDPRLEGVLLTDVQVDRELAFASVYVSSLEGVEREPEIMAGLESAEGFMRSLLTQRIQLRSFPKLRFNWDPTPENADRIDKLIHQIHKDDEQGAAEDESG
jgi:ribosome-binding factor A